MEEEKAHHLFQHFQKTDAAAKQKQGLGFGSASAPPPVADICQNPVGWEAPYKLSDKFQREPEATTSKRSRSSHSHRYSPEKRRRAHSSSSPDRPEHRSRDKATHHRHSDKRHATARHSSHQKHRHEGRHSPSRQHHSGSPDSHHRRHHKTRHSDSSDDRHQKSPSSHHTDSKRESHKHTRREEYPSYSHHDRRRSSHEDRRSRDQQRHSSRSKSSADHTNRAPKAPDYAKLIAGYKYMTDANRLKAVTAYKLGKTSAKNVPSKDGKPWTRFVFNNEALLEEEGAAPDSPAEEGKGPVGLGAFDFRPHRSQQIGKPAEDAHEAAIFGAPAATFDVRPITQSLPCASGSDSDERPQIVELQQQPAQLPAMTNADEAGALQLEDPAPGTANIPKMSWRERALLKKQQQMTS